MTRTSFRNVFGYTLAAMANFDEALEVIAEQLDDAERYRLEFVVPYTLINKAIVACGRREYKVPRSSSMKLRRGPSRREIRQP